MSRFIQLLKISAIGLTLLSGAAQAQQNAAMQNGPQDAAPAKKDPLDGDPRLQVKIQLSSRELTLERALKVLREQTGVRMQTQGDPVGHIRCTAECRDVKLRDLMEALAALFAFVWERDDHGVYMLKHPFDPHGNDWRRPHTEEEARVAEQGRAIVKAVENLPKDLRASVLHDINAPFAESVPLGRMPAEMQQSFGALLTDYAKKLAKNEKRATYVSVEELPNASFQIGVAPDDEGVQQFHLFLNGKKGSEDILITRFDDPRESYAAVSENQLNAPRELPYLTLAEQNRKQARETDSRLKQKITLALQPAPRNRAFREFAQSFNLNYVYGVCDEQRDDLHTFACKDLTMGEALDKLAALYHCVWAETKGGVIGFYYLPPPEFLPAPVASAKP